MTKIVFRNRRLYWKIGKKQGVIRYQMWYWRLREGLPKLYKKIFWKPIYYTCWSRDCDMCESTTAGVVYGGEKAWDTMMDETGEWAEGPVSYERITKLFKGHGASE